MTDILNDFSSSTLTAAIKSNLYAFFRSIRAPSKATDDGAYGFRWHTAVAHPWFNGVLSTQEPSKDGAQTVGDTLAYFRSRDVASFTWWLAPNIEPNAWSEHLLPHGFEYDDKTPGMAANLAELPPPSPAEQLAFTILPVQDRKTLATWAGTLVRGFEMLEDMAGAFLPLMDNLGTDLPAHHYLGLVNGEPVATSTLFLEAGVAGIYNVATLPAARGQGIGSTMTLAPLYEAHEMGYRAGILQSSEVGYSVYRRLGFQRFCQMDHFVYRLDKGS